MMTEPRYETLEIAVCTVCIHLLANGEYDDGTNAADDCARGQSDLWGANARHLIANGDALGFSHFRCDGCGDRLAGDRFRAVVLLPAIAE